MLSRTLRLASPVALALALAGCSGSPSPGSAASSSVTTSSPSAAPATPTSTATSSSATASASTSATMSASTSASTSATMSATTSATTRPAATTTYPLSQQRYTSLLVRAWGVGDRAAAGRYATAEAVRGLFAIGKGGPGWSLLGCDNAGPRPACTFGDPGQGQRLVLFYDADKLGRPRAVVDADFIADDPSAQVQ